MGPTARIQLGDDWVEVRTETTLGDLEYLEMKALERGGKTSQTLQTIELLDRIVTGWSYQEPVTPENIRALLRPAALSEIAQELNRPNSSSPSFDGSRKKGTEGSRRRDG